MTIRNLPPIKAFERPKSLECGLETDVVDRWNAGIRAASDDDTVIEIYDVIGADWYGEGVTAKSIATQLRGKGDVIVSINSPGGDYFEGVAIYNLLREHSGKVTVKIVGTAASAASVIAMAGDVVAIARAATIMIHNAWVLAIGDRHDLADASATLEIFDAAMVDVYAARTGIAKADIAAMMDNTTWIKGDDAVAQGFADELLGADQVEENKSAKAKADTQNVSAIRRVEASLLAQGKTRSERRQLIQDIRSGKPGAAADTVTQDADHSDVVASLRRLSQTLSN